VHAATASPARIAGIDSVLGDRGAHAPTAGHSASATTASTTVRGRARQVGHIGIVVVPDGSNILIVSDSYIN